MAKSALIIGSTGASGRLVTRHLLQSSEYTRIYIIHPKATEFSAFEKVTEIIGSFDNLTVLLKNVPRVDIVFSCIGSTLKRAGSIENFYAVDCSYVLTLGRWAQDVGVSSFHVISYFGADPKAIHYYNRTKGLMEEGLKKLNLPSLVIYHPPLLTGRNNARLGELLGWGVLSLAKPVLVGSLKKYRPLHVSKLANAMIVNSAYTDKQLKIVGSVEMQKL